MKFSVAFTLALAGRAFSEKANVTISHQGPVYWALPIYLADTKGYFDALDLAPSFVVYPSGAPQVKAAVEEQAWDIGAAGIVPNIAAGSEDIYTIGISNDESATNALVAADADAVADYPNLPNITQTENVTFAVTPYSTGHYAVKACLVAAGVDLTHVEYAFGQQAEIMESMENGEVGYGGLWAPNKYTYIETHNESAVVCTGQTANATVPGGIMVREAFAEEEEETLKKVLAAWMRAIVFIQDESNREEVLTAMESFYALYNVSISKESMEEEIDTRPLFNLTEQLEILKRDGDSPSIVDTWYTDVTAFMFEAGVLEDPAEPNDYVTDEYMLMLKDDTELFDFAMGVTELDSGNATSTSRTASDGMKMPQSASSAPWSTKQSWPVAMLSVVASFLVSAFV